MIKIETTPQQIINNPTRNIKVAPKKVKILTKWNLSQRPTFHSKLVDDQDEKSINNQKHCSNNKISLSFGKSPRKHKCSTSHKSADLQTSNQLRNYQQRYTVGVFTPQNSKQSRLHTRILRQKQPYKICQQRKMYRELDEHFQKLKKSIIKDEHKLNMKQLLEFKEKHIDKYLQQFINRVSIKNFTQATILTDVFNFLFNLSSSLLDKMSKQLYHNQLSSVTEITNIHKSYQQRIQQNIQEISKKNKQILDKNHFMKILVQKLKQYKKQMRKMDQCLKLASEKVNEFKQGFIQAQVQCIDLMMESRNISHQNAKAMLNQKILLSMQRHKKFKVVAPKTKKRNKINSQQNKKQENDQNKTLIQQFYDVFQSNKHDKEQNINIIVGALIDSVLDCDYNFDKEKYEVFEEEVIKKSQIQLQNHEYATDMDGFKIDMHDKKIGFGPTDRFIDHITKMRGTQTVLLEQKQPIKKFTNQQVQCNFKDVLKSKLSVKKTLNMDFLFENTGKVRLGHKNYSLQQNMFEDFKRKQNKRETFLMQCMGNENAKNAINEAPNNVYCQNIQSDDESQNSIIEKNLDTEIRQQNSSNQSLGSSVLLDSDKFDELKLKRKKIRLTYQKRASDHHSFAARSPQIKNIKNKDEQILSECEEDIQLQSNILEQTKKNMQVPQNKQPKIQVIEVQTKQIARGKNIKKIVTKQNSRFLKVPGLNTQNKLTKNSNQSLIKMYKGSSQNKPPKRESKSQDKKNIMKKKEFKQIDNNRKSEIPDNQIDITSAAQKIPFKPQKHNKFNNAKRVSARELFQEDKEKIDKKMIKKLYTSIEDQLKNCKQKKTQNYLKNMNDKLLTNIIKHFENALQLVDIDIDNEDPRIGLDYMIVYLYLAIKQSYGVINENQLCKKIKTFVKQIFFLRQKSDIIKLFLFSLGFDLNGNRLEHISAYTALFWYQITKKITKKTEKHLKIAEVSLSTNKLAQIVQIVGSQFHFKDILAQKLLQHLSCILQHQCEVQQKNRANFFSNTIEISSKFTFKIVNEINYFIYNRYSQILTSYEPILCSLPQHSQSQKSNFYQQSLIVQKAEILQQYEVPKSFIEFIIHFNYFQTVKQAQILNKFQQMLNHYKLYDKVPWPNMGLFFLQNGIIDLYRLQYKALGLFKITENQVPSQNYQKVMKYAQNLCIPYKIKQIIVYYLKKNKHVVQQYSQMNSLMPKHEFQHLRCYKIISILVRLKYVDQKCQNQLGILLQPQILQINNILSQNYRQTY